ncbi:MAG: aminotransferase class III-fold pyridoxal phosphate-dependent enzyme, partial [Albidovulum sp.]|uniref:aminotransferase class III-fold pyridoxal phosphate-dependent enzyme n=1 Tax=Albidovulum sp. TaxID=1872424 RepID=UPI003C8519B7
MEKTLKNSETSTIWAQDRAHFTHPWTHFDSFRKEGSLVMDRAEGIHIYDADGNRYLDSVGGLWCMNIGYGREEMVEAIAAQTRRMAFASPFVDMTNAPAAQLAAKLAELAPGSLNHVLFGCGGSTGNDSAFRLIQYYWACKGQKHRRHIIARTGSYHGTTYAAQSIGGKPTDRSDEFDFIADIIHHVAEPNIH